MLVWEAELSNELLHLGRVRIRLSHHTPPLGKLHRQLRESRLVIQVNSGYMLRPHVYAAFLQVLD